MSSRTTASATRTQAARPIPVNRGVPQRQCDRGDRPAILSRRENRGHLSSLPVPSIQATLQLGAPGDPFEHAASRTASAMLHGGNAEAWHGLSVLPGSEARGVPILSRLASRLRSLDGGGRPLPSSARQFFEPRFGYDLSLVRVHADPPASDLAAGLDARAFALGRNLIFNRSEYAPDTTSGRELLAHELAHVAQDARAPETGRIVRRQTYGKMKEMAYEALIATLRSAHRAASNRLRSLAKSRLPSALQPVGEKVVECLDLTIGGIVAVILAVIGILVGVGEGLVSMVTGLLKLGYGVLTLLYDLIVGIFTNFDALKQDINAVYEAVVGLPAALKKLFTDWLDEFQKASGERQSLMIGELTGQVIALIATFELAAGRAAGPAEVAGGAGAATSTAGAVTEAAGTAGKTGPVLKFIEGGGAASGTAASGGETIGNTALKVAPVTEELPKVTPLKLVAPEVGTEAGEVASASGKARQIAAAGLTAAGALTKAKPGDSDEKPLNAMRFQVQWDSKNKGPTFAEVATAAADPGVTVAEAVGKLDAAVAKVTPKAAQKAAGPAADKQKTWIRARPPAGIAKGGDSRSEHFDYRGYPDARVDVENLRGHNLRR